MNCENVLYLECGVCLENIHINSINFMPCIHFLCVDCYNKLYKNECPFCRNVINEEKELDSYDEQENEYNDVDFEILVLEERNRKNKKKKDKKREKKIIKLIRDNSEIVISVNRNNTYEILSTISTD